jgi:hypothetical protein
MELSISTAHPVQSKQELQKRNYLQNPIMRSNCKKGKNLQKHPTIS